MALLSLASCGSVSQSVPARQSSLPPGERLYIWNDEPGSASQRLIAFHPGSTQALTLPVGLVSQDHQRLYAATASGDHTTIAIYDTQTGAVQRTFTVPGTYSTSGMGFADAVLSGDGHWLALRGMRPVAGKTSLAVVDTQTGTLAAVTLDGDFELDGISPAGTMLYLIQQLGDSGHHYYVRAYGVVARALVEGIIVDKTAIDEAQMNGAPLTRQTVRDGSRAYTLYIDPERNIAFIHGLPLANDANGPLFARCIDLPVGATGDLLPYYTLALSADGKTLYAANAALGLVTSVSAQGDIFSVNITSTSGFGSGIIPLAAMKWGQVLSGGSALSADQKTLYVAGAHGIWAIDTASLRLRQSFLTDRAFSSLAASADGQTLYAVDPSRSVVVISLSTGKITSTLSDVAPHPMSIGWVAG
ncbi:MAG TPA: hypothetical protein VF807_05250 [Ktedonobacterales bacterium]